MSLTRAVIITGATATGKSTLAHSLCQKDDILVNADSRQIYKYFNIGTAKPPLAQLRQYNYHLIDFLEPEARYSAFCFYRDIGKILAANAGKRIFIVGGTQFYINVLKQGLPPHAPVDWEIRAHYEKIYRERGLSPLLAELYAKDKSYYDTVDRSNHRRVVRALEYIKAAGKTFTSLRLKQEPPRLKLLTFVVHTDRNILYRRIDERVERMIKAGLESEARQLWSRYSGKNTAPFSSIGYKEWTDYFKQKCTREETVATIKKHTRRFAKQQITWCKKQTNSFFINFSNNNHPAEKTDKWFYDKITFSTELYSLIRRDKFTRIPPCRFKAEPDLPLVKKIIKDFYAA